MKLDYKVKKQIEENHSIEIENDNFICVEHTQDGRRMITAFIGKGENNNNKLSIKLSTMGGVLDIKNMAGDSVSNAVLLLKQNSKNIIVSIETFKYWYNITKERMVLDFGCAVSQHPA